MMLPPPSTQDLTTQPIAFHRPWLGPEEVEAVVEAVRAGHLTGNGPICRMVEEELRRRLGVAHVLLTPSCTSAMELAYLALGIGPGADVLLPSFTFVSCATAVVRSGARPVFIDIDPLTLMLDLEKVQRALTPQSRAILGVHYGGFPCDIEGLLALAKRSNVQVIEDAAQAFGSSWRSHPLGTLGDVGCLSFHGTKNVTCGEGGALITHDDAVAQRALLIREKGTNREAFLQQEVDRYAWVDTGGSFVLSDLLAAVLLAQLRRMEAIARARQAIAHRYLEALQPLSEAGRLRLPVVQDPHSVNWHLFYLLLPTRVERDEVLRGLREAGIEASFHFVPLHSSPYAQRQYGYRPTDLPVTEEIAQRLVRLPIYPNLTPEEQERIITVLRHVVR